MTLLILFIICAVNISLGAMILLRDHKQTSSRAFGLLSVMVTVWVIANYLTDHFAGPGLIVNDISNRVAYMAAFAAVASGLWFTYHFPVQQKMQRKELIAVVTGVALLFALSPTQYIAGVVSRDQSGLLFTHGSLTWLYVTGFIVMILLIARNLLRSARRGNASDRRQAHLIIIAFCVSALFGLFTNVVLPMSGVNWGVTQIGPLSTLVLVGVTAYAMVRHGLFDIRSAIVRSVTYGLSIVTLAVLYLIVAMGISTLFFDPQQQNAQTPLNIILALGLAFAFQPVKRLFDTVTSRIFSQDTYSSDDFFARLNRVLTSTPDLHTLLERAAAEVVDTLKADQGYFYVNIKDDHHVSTGRKGYSQLLLVDCKMLDSYVAAHGDGMIIQDELKQGHIIQRLMERHKISLILPLAGPDQIIGYMCLGRRRSNHYTHRDTVVIETASDQLVIAIQNALAVQEIKMFNETLQDRIDEATKQLRASNAQLQRLDTAKDEFVSMASHQLRTPLTSVKGYIDMVLDGDAGSITDMQRKLLSEAFTSSERMVHLINDFLNVSRLQTGKFMIDRRKVDLSKVVSQEVASLQTTAKSRNLTLDYRQPSVFPILYVDESKVRQVIMNFIDNAFYYSREHSTITVKLMTTGGDVILTVKDTGMGVPPAEQVHLFTKFFRATNARKQRPDGTGVGLFLAKKVIVAHGGSMVFESVEGKGSTFGFRLPIRKLSLAPVDETDDLDD